MTWWSSFLTFLHLIWNYIKNYWQKIINYFKKKQEREKLLSYFSSKVIFPSTDSNMKPRYCECFELMVDDLTLVPMMHIIYSQNNLKIRFDKNLILNDPECNQYSSKQIIIGVKGMISENKSPEKIKEENCEISGRVAQKFCNYTMQAVFKNKSKPYFDKDGDKFKTKFEEISKKYKEKYRRDRPVDLERYLIIF